MTDLTNLDGIRAAIALMPQGSEEAEQDALKRQSMLTKPAGSLGRLESLAAWCARWQMREQPSAERIQIVVFAGSHGVTRRGVSAFPPEVTAQMVENFAAGGAAINQLARVAGAELSVVPLDVARPTADFTQGPAMSEAELQSAMVAGIDSVLPETDLLAVGEMGIGNTTSAAALCALLLGGSGADWVGRGTGVDNAGLARKAEAVDLALATHAGVTDPLAALAAVGGREIAAMCGAILAARFRHVPVVLDGFVATAAAVPLFAMAEGALDHCVAGHVSAEAGHRRLLSSLRLDPLLDLGMRLGEASGAAVALNLVSAAIACHNGMASFTEAGVSGAGD